MIINPISEKQVDIIAKNLPQSLLISGDYGINLREIGEEIAKTNGVKAKIVLPEDKKEKIDEKNGSITIGIIRRLLQMSGTKNTAKNIIIIDYAEKMTHQAQNAFLKLLEEPTKNLYFILLSHQETHLLPTILSRVENIRIRPITVQQSIQLLNELKITDKTKQAQLLYIAAGLPEELAKLATDKDYFIARSKNMRQAREMLQGSNIYQKLLIMQSYKDNRAETLQLLTDMENILQKSLAQNPQKPLFEYLDKVLMTYQQINASGNIRLCLARMIL